MRKCETRCIFWNSASKRIDYMNVIFRIPNFPHSVPLFVTSRILHCFSERWDSISFQSISPSYVWLRSRTKQGLPPFLSLRFCSRWSAISSQPENDKQEERLCTLWHCWRIRLSYVWRYENNFKQCAVKIFKLLRTTIYDLFITGSIETTILLLA